jgi:hypothetical protein
MPANTPFKRENRRDHPEFYEEERLLPSGDTFPQTGRQSIKNV